MAGRLTGTKMGDRAVRTGTKEKEELEERKKKKVRDEDKEGFQIDSDYKAPLTNEVATEIASANHSAT